MEKVQMLEDLIGKKIDVWTINANYTGIVDSIEGEWIKIISDTKRHDQYILKVDMITSITVLP